MIWTWIVLVSSQKFASNLLVFMYFSSCGGIASWSSCSLEGLLYWLFFKHYSSHKNIFSAAKYCVFSFFCCCWRKSQRLTILWWFGQNQSVPFLWGSSRWRGTWRSLRRRWCGEHLTPWSPHNELRRGSCHPAGGERHSLHINTWLWQRSGLPPCWTIFQELDFDGSWSHSKV